MLSGRQASVREVPHRTAYKPTAWTIGLRKNDHKAQDHSLLILSLLGTSFALRLHRIRMRTEVDVKVSPLAKTAIGLTAVGATYALVQHRRKAVLREAENAVEVHGFVNPGYEAVRAAFAENFAHRREVGAACCVYHKGVKVVDLWGGWRNKANREPWEENTMALVYSATKGLAAMTLAVAQSRGWLDYDELVSTYWPEFAQNGKEKITVRQLLAHQAGLFALDEPLDRSLVADLDRLAEMLARHRPAWEPGTRQAYHGLTLGFYEG